MLLQRRVELTRTEMGAYARGRAEGFAKIVDALKARVRQRFILP